MKKWMLKAALQKSISLLPFSFQINYFFQRYVTKNVVVSDEFFETMLGHFQELRFYTEQAGYALRGMRVLEIGTGWHPVMPMCFYLAGCTRVETVDLRSLVRKGNLLGLIHRFVVAYQDNRLEGRIGVVDPERIRTFIEILKDRDSLSTREILDRCRISVKIGALEQLEFSGHFDLVCSVNVLEHIAAPALHPIFCRVSELHASGGIQYHAIGVYDHFVHIDPSISKFNYLRFSEQAWRRIDNNIQPQNRWRISQFRDLFVRHDFEIRNEIHWTAEPEELARVLLHEDFKDVRDADIPYGTFILETKSEFSPIS